MVNTMKKVNKGAKRRLFCLFIILVLLVTYVSYTTFSYWKEIFKNTTLEKGCIRSRRFINEFNKKLGLHIDIKFIDEIKNGKCKTYK